ncbi:MAG: hypothetical protein RBR06_07370 [Desulfuromonadaceae bacterium]|nr:hypothetical protein [Desulfuromonadaceae bacterium]
MNNTLSYAPSATTPWLIPGSIKAHYRIKVPLLFPPIMVNLRKDRNPADPCTRDLLTARELNYFRNNGNNATLFIHGFNVPYGKFPRQIDTITAPKPMDCLRPNVAGATFLNTDATVYRNIDGLKRRFSELDTAGLSLPESLQEKNLNGEAAHSWVIHLEDNLNRAAGFDRTDYSKFTRIINVAWSGDVFPTNYIQAELNANRAGAKVARLIIQLTDAGIRPNIIAHSLGNRVLLVAMNLLGQMPSRKECVENVFMWQPAVPDTALSNNPAKDTSVLRNWNFIHAHRTAKTIMVLYSGQDNILGPHRSAADVEFDRGDGVELRSGQVKGLYTLAQHAGVPQFPGIDQDEVFAPWGIRGFYQTWAKNAVGDNWASFEKSLNEEIQKDPDGLFTQNLAIRDYEKALPLAYVLRVRRQMGDDFLKTLKALIATDYEIKKPRPAMGYTGPERDDPHLREMLQKDKLLLVNQTPWLFSHSGMKIPSDILFREVYKLRIVDQIRRTTGFGKY